MPELGPYGSVRGALSNERPYRDLRNVGANYPFERSHRFAGIQPNSELRRWGNAARAYARIDVARWCLLRGQPVKIRRSFGSLTHRWAPKSCGGFH